MSRLSELKLDNSGYNRGATGYAWNPAVGGQQGYSSKVRDYITNQAHKSSQLQAVVLTTPGVFAEIDDGAMHVATIKAMVELHTLTITGFDQQITVETDQHAVGSAGQMQEEFTNTVRAQPSINMTMVDKYGRPLQKELDFWIRFLMMDPDTNFPLAPLVGNRNLADMGPDMYSMSCLFFEPNVTWSGINRAWLVVNMWPKGTGESTSQKDLTQGSTILNLSIDWAGLAQVGYGVDQLAYKIMRAIDLTNADPYYRKAAIDGVSADVKAAGDNDWVHSVENTGREAVDNVFVGGGRK